MSPCSCLDDGPAVVKGFTSLWADGRVPAGCQVLFPSSHLCKVALAQLEVEDIHVFFETLHLAGLWNHDPPILAVSLQAPITHVDRIANQDLCRAFAVRTCNRSEARVPKALTLGQWGVCLQNNAMTATERGDLCA